jgi:hypothetical protein
MCNLYIHTPEIGAICTILAIPGRHLVVNFLYGMIFEWWHLSPCWVHRHCCDAQKIALLNRIEVTSKKGWNWENLGHICRLIPFLSGKNRWSAMLWQYCGWRREAVLTNCEFLRPQYARLEAKDGDLSERPGVKVQGRVLPTAGQKDPGAPCETRRQIGSDGLGRQGLDEMLTHAAYPLATTPLVNLVRV